MGANLAIIVALIAVSLSLYCVLLALIIPLDDKVY
jgi:hypothetical protein